MQLSKIKKELRPDTSVLKEVEDFVKKINNEIQKNKLKANCVTGGSVAKGTFLKGDFDVDLFVKFDTVHSNISELLQKILKPFKPELVHGSRDYFQIKKNLNYEIVPVIDIKDPEQAENVTDMSPLHVDWVKKNLTKDQDDEIRLIKKFCKSIEVYGAESYIKGFSGHVLDILIINYGSFIHLLKASQKWKPKVIIDTEKYYKNSRDLLFDMNQSKISGPMIVIDPILKTRNAASALSYEKFTIFKKRASDYLKNPSMHFFVEKIIGKTFLKRKYNNLIILIIKSKRGKEDVIGSKLLKAFKFLKIELIQKGFIIKNSGWTWNKKQRALFWFVFKELILPEEQTIGGPPLDKTDHVLNFKKKYRNSYDKRGKLYAKVKISTRAAHSVIKEITKMSYFQQKINNVKIEDYS